MRLTEWTPSGKGFEEAQIVMDNGEILFVLRRWDDEFKLHPSMHSVFMGIVRSGHNMHIVADIPKLTSREELVAKVHEFLELPVKEFKSQMGIKGQQICGMFPKKFKAEVAAYLNKERFCTDEAKLEKYVR